jgi:hypothetical protein
VIKLSNPLEIRTHNYNSLIVAGPRYDQRKRRNQTAAGKNRFRVRERVSRKGSAVPPYEDNVRAVIAELAPQLGLHVDVEIQHGSGNRGGHDHGKQCRSSPSATQHGGPYQHPKKHGRM